MSKITDEQLEKMAKNCHPPEWDSLTGAAAEMGYKAAFRARGVEVETLITAMELNFEKYTQACSVLESENARLREQVEKYEDIVSIYKETAECRADEDCDHCYIEAILGELRAAKGEKS